MNVCDELLGLGIVSHNALEPPNSQALSNSLWLEEAYIYRPIIQEDGLLTVDSNTSINRFVK